MVLVHSFAYIRNKATGSDGVVIDMLAALDDFGIDKVTKIIN